MSRRTGVLMACILALAACSSQPAPSASSIIKDIGAVKAADVMPQLVAALRTDFKPEMAPGVDLPTLYAASDKQMLPLIADLEARLAEAPKRIGTAPDPIVSSPATTSTRQTPPPVATFALLTAADTGRIYIDQKTFDAGEQFTGDGIVEDVKGVAETYIENGEVITHWDMNGKATKDTGEGATAETVVTVNNLLIGQSVAADGKPTGQKTYVDLCPDEGGLSHGKLYFQMVGGTTTNNTNGQATFVVSADLVGHVDDSATLTSYDMLNLSFQRSASGTASSDSAGFFADGISVTGAPPAGPEGTERGPNEKATASAAARSAVHNMKAADVQREIALMAMFAKIHAQKLFHIAEKSWQHGYCVKVAATTGPNPKQLKPGETTHFTIEMFHKPDDAKLDVPVVATPHNGKVDPGAKPVMAPAKFSFTANGGQPTSYVVDLKSTSRRGIGELSLNFSPLSGYQIKVVTHQSGGGPPPNDSTITGAVTPDPTDPTGTVLRGPGQLEGHVFVNSDLGCPGTWQDAGLKTFPVELTVTAKGDGTFEVQMTGTGAGAEFLGTTPISVATFPRGNGEEEPPGIGDPAVATGTNTLSDSCDGDNGPVPLTTIINWSIEADPTPT
jgi:hypothetical protein